MSKKKRNFDLEVSQSVLEWMNYIQSNTVPLEHRVSIKDAHQAYIDKPSHDTAAEVVTLVRFFMEKPVP